MNEHHRRGNLPRVAKAGARASVAARQATAAARAHNLADKVKELRRGGAASLREIAEGLNAQEITAPRGGEWQAGQVARVLQLMDARAAA
jgi:hypothetical protein